MENDLVDSKIPFSPGEWLVDNGKPWLVGQFTGKWRRSGPHIMVQLSYPDGTSSYRPLSCLRQVPLGDTIEDRLRRRQFGRLRDIQRLITHEKLKGILYEVIYSMEAAQIDFYPYQFKPVLKFINSPTDRLIIADEVGLGKTIESALIWIEFQARRQARRLLVVCPRTLVEKWHDELRSKFLLDANMVDFDHLRREIECLRREGPDHSFVLIASYTGLRPPKRELRFLREEPNSNSKVSPKTKLLQEFRHWQLNFSPFDMVIFDEAHYMRNPSTATFHLGETLAECASAVLCVSATPVNNSNADLHSLLRLTDEPFFGSQATFEMLLEANRPTVQAANALARHPIDMTLLRTAVMGMRENEFIRKSPLFAEFENEVSRLIPGDKAQIAKCQDLAEKLNILGNYINRTRRVQVKESRPVRDPKVLTVEYSKEEMSLYQTILWLVRAKCARDSRPFHIFQLMGLQLRAASCLPVVAREIKEGRFGEIEDLIYEAEEEAASSDTDISSVYSTVNELSSLEQLLYYDYEKNDSKYRELLRLLTEVVPDEKVLIFAYYRPTLAYLLRRLGQDGIAVTVIHGGMPIEQRWEEIERFRDPRGPRVLLSSEVGSEGIDLQFCRVMVNYDLPWNPMRVEQRIGRIDRVGQQAKRLSIVNFKVRGTIEERLYTRLHSKLERFANSLGDLEAVIGREVRNLTVELLSKDLSPEEELTVMEQSERVIEERLIQIRALEESGDALIAFSDYVQRKIEEGRKRGRYLQPGELEDYLSDFFEREFPGCEMNFNTPAEGCLRIRLSNEARRSLRDFIRDDRSLSATFLRQREFYITFRREVHKRLPSMQQRAVHFVNHLSPLIRWVAKMNTQRAHNFFNVSALLIEYSELPPGDYCYRIERWKFSGLVSREVLAYGIGRLEDGVIYSSDKSEAVVQHLLRDGKDWDYVHCNDESLLHVHGALVDDMIKRFDKAAAEFDAENRTAYQIRSKRVRDIFDRRIDQDKRRLETLRKASRDQKVIAMTERRISMLTNNRDQQLKNLKERCDVDMEQAQVAAGIFRVVTRVR